MCDITSFWDEKYYTDAAKKERWRKWRERRIIFQYKGMTKGTDNWKVNDGASQIKQPWTGKIWKKGTKGDSLAKLQLHFWGELKESSQRDYFDYTCPPVSALLSVFTGEQWFLSTVNAPPRPTFSFSLLLSSSSPSSECIFPTTGFEVGLEGS